MKRWDGSTSPSKEVEDPAVDAFLSDLIDVCVKHGMSLGHEDGHGAFLVHKPEDEASIHEHNRLWLAAAHIAKPESY